MNFAKLVSIALTGVFLGASACGGTDIVEDTPDGASSDGSALDGGGSTDGTLPDDGSGNPDSTLDDGGMDATLTDGSGMDGTAKDGGDGGTTDGNTGDGAGSDGGDGGILIGPDGGIGGSCSGPGVACQQPNDCCSLVCQGGVCGGTLCISDNQGCSRTSGPACCSGACSAGGVCNPLNNTCKTLGNACAGSAECCSGLCKNNICATSSFCGQVGDTCSRAADCCGGICTIGSGAALGTCALPPKGPANCKLVDGQLCAGSLPDGGTATTDAGVPACGGACCSRACAPYGPTGVLVCQPATGCHVTGDLCRADSDCCGGPGTAGPPPNMPTVCVITSPNLVGICKNANGCKPNGDVCRLQTNQCNASADCCSGNVLQNDTCKQDNLGIPRCTNAQCSNPGVACSTSADCCNGEPCVPNPAVTDGGVAEFICSALACVSANGLCTVTADCCAGGTCIVPLGSTRGTCFVPPPPAPPDAGVVDSGSDSGGLDAAGLDAAGLDAGTADAALDAADATPPPPCAQYGQLCTTGGDCCNGVTCIGGRCLSN